MRTRTGTCAAAARWATYRHFELRPNEGEPVPGNLSTMFPRRDALLQRERAGCAVRFPQVRE